MSLIMLQKGQIALPTNVKMEDFEMADSSLFPVLILYFVTSVSTYVNPNHDLSLSITYLLFYLNLCSIFYCNHDDEGPGHDNRLPGQ